MGNRTVGFEKSYGWIWKIVRLDLENRTVGFGKSLYTILRIVTRGIYYSPVMPHEGLSGEQTANLGAYYRTLLLGIIISIKPTEGGMHIEQRNVRLMKLWGILLCNMKKKEYICTNETL